MLSVSLVCPYFSGFPLVPVMFLTCGLRYCFVRPDCCYLRTLVAASLPFFSLCLDMVPGLNRVGISPPFFHLEPQWLPVAPRMNLEFLHGLQDPPSSHPLLPDSQPILHTCDLAPLSTHTLTAGGDSRYWHGQLVLVGSHCPGLSPSMLGILLAIYPGTP